MNDIPAAPNKLPEAPDEPVSEETSQPVAAPDMPDDIQEEEAQPMLERAMPPAPDKPEALSFEDEALPLAEGEAPIEVEAAALPELESVVPQASLPEFPPEDALEVEAEAEVQDEAVSDWDFIAEADAPLEDIPASEPEAEFDAELLASSLSE